MTSFATIRTADDDGVLTIALNRPDALNALNEPLAMELNTALRMAQRDEKVRCVVLTGTGRAFCAGQDLKVLDPEHPGFDTLLRQGYNPLIIRIRSMEKPVVAAVNGVAAGAGVSLALATDLRICG